MGNDGNEKVLEKAVTEGQVAAGGPEGAPGSKEEKLNAFQKFMNSLFGEKSEEADDAKKAESTEKKEDEKRLSPRRPSHSRTSTRRSRPRGRSGMQTPRKRKELKG